MQTISVLGFAGSLRERSYNRALLRAARALVPEGMVIEIFDLTGVPLYNADIEAVGDPETVVTFKAAVRKADALLIACPEYNHGVPGVLKNAIDWASRPPRSAPLDRKPIALIGASPGIAGTARGQSQLRQAFEFTNSYALPQPEMLVAHAHEKFDTHGELTDQETREHLRRLLGALADWTMHFLSAARV